MMGMRDRNSQRIRRIGAGNPDSGQEPRNHGMNLRLFGITDAHDSLLDKARGIFADFEAGPCDRKQTDPPRLPELQGRLRIGIDEDFFNSRSLRAVLDHQVGQGAVECNQPFRQRRLGIGGNLPIGNMAKPVSNRCDHAPAGRPQSRIEAENDQPSFSITSSGTS